MLTTLVAFLEIRTMLCYLTGNTFRLDITVDQVLLLFQKLPIHRPKGQKKPPTAEVPVFGNSNLLDFELETAFITFDANPLGDSISTEEADDYIFGMALFNDWSARDIQGWEYVPLGPFLGKNFASSLSPWIVTLDALEPFRTAGPIQDPKVFPYLEYEGRQTH